MGIESEKKIASYLSANIKTLRDKKRFSQKQLASVAGIPRSTLTHIESGDGNPSLSNLIRISGALAVSIEELLSRPRGETLLVLEKDVPIIEKSGGMVLVKKLLPDKLKGLEIERVEFAGNSSMVGSPHLSGTKEYMTVLQGEIKVYLGGEAHLVKRGDVFAFPGNQPHSYRNQLKTKSIAISVVIPIPANI